MEYLYETHMHTSESSGCGGSTAEEQVRAYKKRGYQGVIITDHFINGYSLCPRHSKIPWAEKMGYVICGYQAAKAAGDSLGLDVFFGWEFTIRGSDFLTYGLDWDFLIANPYLDELDVPEYSSLVRNSGGFLAQAHPYRDRSYIEHKFPVNPQYVDAIEVYNVSDTNAANIKAWNFAKKHGLPVQSGSDSHNVHPHFVSGVRLYSKAESIYDVIDAIKGKRAGLILP